MIVIMSDEEITYWDSKQEIYHYPSGKITFRGMDIINLRNTPLVDNFRRDLYENN